MNFAHAEVATLDPTTMRTLCEEYIANNYIDPETSERLGVKRGLRNPDGTGVLAGLTNVCDVVGYKKDQEGHVIPTPGKLIYRGVNINEIVDEAYRNDRFHGHYERPLTQYHEQVAALCAGPVFLR